MQNSTIKKSLVIGIIILFIGMGIQQAFAYENISINRTSSENIDDCNCQANDNYDIVRIKSLLNRAERSLNRVEILIKFIPILSKNNPEIIEDCEELSDKIKDLSIIVDELTIALSGQDNTIICAILEAMLNVVGIIYMVGENILNLTYIIFQNNPIIANFIVQLDTLNFFIAILIISIIATIMVNYDCVEYPIGS